MYCFVFLPIVVLIVLVADVERRIGEHQVDRAGVDPLHQFDAVALMNLADFERGNGEQLGLHGVVGGSVLVRHDGSWGA